MKGFTFKKDRVGNGLFVHSFFKSFIVFVVMMIMTTSSASAEVIDGLCYDLNSDTKTAVLLPRTDEKYSGDIIIPEKVKGNDGVEYIVTTFADNCFEDCRGLTSITIPSSVTSLGKYCFADCRGLTSITIPSSVTSLGKYCFADCRGLTSITIPSSVSSLDDLCFLGCTGLTSITIPSSVTSLGKYCFSNCSSLTSITIPSSVSSLDYYCFDGCSSLTSITIPSSVTSLVEGCFSNCSSLTSIDIPSSVTSLDYYCFAYCSGLTSITIPSSVTSLGKDCFSGCKNIETIYFKGELPRANNYYRTGIPYKSIIKVPSEYLQDYKKAFGSEYKYIFAWNPNESGDGDKPATPCATPSVSYELGEFKFACETAGAKYHYTISSRDMATDALSEDGKVSLSAAYHISVYATADGYTRSQNVSATLYWINANIETKINPTKTRGIVASAHDGIVSISGLDNGEIVNFYAADGKFLGSSSAAGRIASCAVSEKMVIAKIGKDTIKVLMK